MSLVPGALVVPSDDMPDAVCMRHCTTEDSPWRRVRQDDVLLVVGSHAEPWQVIVLHMREQRIVSTNDITYGWLEAA